MLAPLKARARELIDREPSDGRPANFCDEMNDLRTALRESRARLRHSAWESTRIITRLHDEIRELQNRCTHYQQQLARYESGVAVIDMGRDLMRLHDEVEELRETARRAWTLEHTLEAAHGECQRLAQERDELAAALAVAVRGPGEARL